MITLYAVRHGETDYNRESRVQGLADSHLTDFGRQQAAALAKHFKDVKITSLFASPLSRASDTADAIATAAGIDEITLVDEFKELDCGLFTDMLISEIKETCWEDWMRFLGDPAVAPENGESMNQLAARVSKALGSILKNAGENDTIMIVAHAGVVRMILSHLMDVSVGSAVNFGLSNASITSFIYKYERWTCLKWNDTEHLGSLEGEVKFVL